jgi:predicted GTPase
MPKEKFEKENFYDVIIKINLLNELMIDGWEISYSKEKYEQNINTKLIPISVIGESNRGKSYLLGRICNIDLPIGFNEKT